MALTATTVSRKLRALGFLPVPRHSRDGVSVSRSILDGEVLVEVSIEDAGAESRMAANVLEALQGLGYAVRVHAGTHFYVSEA